MPTKAEQEGSCTVYYRNSEDYTLLRSDQADLIEIAWTKGQAFFVGYGMHGTREVIKLAEVSHIHVITPEQWELIQEEKRIDRLENGED